MRAPLWYEEVVPVHGHEALGPAVAEDLRKYRCAAVFHPATLTLADGSTQREPMKREGRRRPPPSL